jgi:hypothetical protein
MKLFRRSDRFIQSRKADAPVLKIGFSDFWPGFDEADNYLTEMLLRQFSLLISAKPDYLIFSNFGTRHKHFKCKKIFFTGENIRPNFNECDFAFTFDHLDDPRHYRLPLYGWWDDAETLLKSEDIDCDAILAGKTKFCNFIYGNAVAQRRVDFMQALSRYKPVDCAGTLMNNIGRTVSVFEKVEFLKDYKFTIAFENTEQDGYTTEKLVQPMFAQSIAIYWGNPLVHLDFNPRSFVNMYEFASDEDAIQRIIALDQDDDAYKAMLTEPFYNGNRVNPYVNPDNILARFRQIFGIDRA